MLPVRFSGDDVTLTAALKSGRPGAMEALYDRYAGHVERVLVRVMGFDPELYDLLQEVFIEAFRSKGAIKDGQALKAWVTTLAVFTARQCIRKRRRRRAYWVNNTDHCPDPPGIDADPASLEVLRAVYQTLSTMAVDDRIVFSLRFIEGMEVAEVAEACSVSVSTAKRRLRRAEGRFADRARKYPALLEWVEKWNRRRHP